VHAVDTPLDTKSVGRENFVFLLLSIIFGAKHIAS